MKNLNKEQGIFIFRVYDAWCKDPRIPKTDNPMKYLHLFNPDEFLATLPVDTPLDVAVDKLIQHCYEHGGRIMPPAYQKPYPVQGKNAQTLYIIGNGFDRYHGAESSYWHFRQYLLRCMPQIVGSFDLYWGPRTLSRSFEHKDDYKRCLLANPHNYPQNKWTEDHLWCDFERYMAELNREKVMTLADMYLPRVDEGEEGFRYADYYLPIDRIKEQIYFTTFEMRYRFHKWINTLHYAKGFRKKMLPLDTDALFLNFNYTLFLESEYNVPQEQICYIHGSRRDKYGSLVLGHSEDSDLAFKKWCHKHENEARFRPNLKDKKGRWYANDRLTYLSYFIEDETKGNWRLPIRYYAQEAIQEAIEGYYEQSMKYTSGIIDQNAAFFDSLKDIKRIVVIGHSLADVDMPYFEKIMDSVDKDQVQWEIYYHTDRDIKNINHFCKRLGVSAQTTYL